MDEQSIGRLAGTYHEDKSGGGGGGRKQKVETATDLSTDYADFAEFISPAATRTRALSPAVR